MRFFDRDGIVKVKKEVLLMQSQQELISALESVMGMTITDAVLSSLPSLLINVAVYVLVAVSMHAIASRRGIMRPWLAWIPFANMYMLGCISDQYRSVVRREEKSRRKLLLGLEIPKVLLNVGVTCLSIMMVLGMVAQGLDLFLAPENVSEEVLMEMVSAVLGYAAGIMLLGLPLVVILILSTVFGYIALSDIFKSCDPANATVYTVLSIAVGMACNVVFGLPVGVLPAIFLMVCRKKDIGMPFRTVEAPAYEIPQWQQPQTPAEPWEQNRE